MELEESAQTAVRQCVNLRSGESVVVVTDEKRKKIADSLYEVSSEITDDVIQIVYPAGDNHGEEPPSGVAEAMKNTDVFFAPTTKSITHTRAVSKAVESGSRGSTLPGITEEAFSIGLSADYSVIMENCNSLHSQLRDAEEIRYVTELGTDLRFKPREWHLDKGDISSPSTYANLPSGEIFTAPKSVNGTVVYDGSMRPHGRLEEPIEVKVEDGCVTSISDDGLESLIESAAEDSGKSAYNLAEVAIGANPAVSELTGNILLDEKAAGTVHVAIGDNINFGGNVEASIHEDGVITNPEVYADGERVTIPEPN
jgi:leucyl aminopeptidase (aminopeptidase T)